MVSIHDKTSSLSEDVLAKSSTKLLGQFYQFIHFNDKFDNIV